MADIYTKVPHVEYIKLVKRCEELEKELAAARAEVKRFKTAKVAVTAAPKTVEKTETKKEVKKND